MAKKSKEVKEEVVEAAEAEEVKKEAAPVESEEPKEEVKEQEEVEAPAESEAKVIKNDTVKELVESAKTHLVNLGYSNPSKKDKEFAVEFVAKSNPDLYTSKVVAAAKSAI